MHGSGCIESLCLGDLVDGCITVIQEIESEHAEAVERLRKVRDELIQISWLVGDITADTRDMLLSE